MNLEVIVIRLNRTTLNQLDKISHRLNDENGVTSLVLIIRATHGQSDLKQLRTADITADRCRSAYYLRRKR